MLFSNNSLWKYINKNCVHSKDSYPCFKIVWLRYNFYKINCHHCEHVRWCMSLGIVCKNLMSINGTAVLHKENSSPMSRCAIALRRRPATHITCVSRNTYSSKWYSSASKLSKSFTSQCIQREISHIFRFLVFAGFFLYKTININFMYLLY